MTDENVVQKVTEVNEGEAKRRRGPNKPKEITPTQAVLLEVEAERQAQDKRWGEQNHPQQGGNAPAKGIAHYAELADQWKRFNDARVKAGTLGFDSILLEEVYEALGEESPGLRREELLQVAAVAVCAVEALDRNGSGEPAPAAAAA